MSPPPLSELQVSRIWKIFSVSEATFDPEGCEILIGSAGAIDVKLTEEEIKLLEEPYKAQAVAGHQ